MQAASAKDQNKTMELAAQNLVSKKMLPHHEVVYNLSPAMGQLSAVTCLFSYSIVMSPPCGHGLHFCHIMSLHADHGS